MDKLRMQTLDGVQDNIDKIAALFPNCITERKDAEGKVTLAIDFDKLRQELSSEIVEGREERYQFTWPDKKKAILLANSPINATLRPCREESVDFDNTQNLYIEGDNLDVLKCLKETYLGKVKMIYIDPPYNTGNDFVYEDNFAESTSEYLANSGQYDEQGNRLVTNSENNGRFHTDWLNMIYPRLKVARDLRTDDGVIFISIDDNEVENLRKVCDEVFGEDNFVAQLVWERAFSPKNDAKYISNSHDYIMMYSRQINEFIIGRLDRTEEANARYSNPDNDPRGVWMSSDISVKTYNAACDYPITTPSGKIIEPPAGRCWRLSKNAFFERLRDNRISFGVDGNSVPCIKRFLSELKFDGMAPTSILFYKEVGHSQEGAKEVVSLFGDKGVFDGPKPVRLLQRLITLANLKEDSIVLDFFSGSASTAHALMKTNSDKDTDCRFIMVQLPEEVSDTKKDQGYKNICEIGKERIRRAGAKIKADFPLTTQNLDTGFRVYRLDESNYEKVSISPKEYKQDQLDLFANNIKADRTDLDLLYGSMLAWGVRLDLPLQTETVDGCTIYIVNEGDLVACFSEGITDKVVAAMAEKSPLRVLFRDACFKEDAQKINIYEQFKQALDWADNDAFNNIRVI